MKRSAIASGAVAAGALLALGSLGAYAQSKKWYPFSVEEHNPPFDMSSPLKEVMYTPLEKADKKWNICVSFPHMKDAYWLAVDYGVSEEAKDLGVAMHLVEAGGYTNLSLVGALERLVEPATLGDPMRPLIWCRKAWKSWRRL